MKRLLVIDNFDSFTYNLVQYFGELGADVEVKRNDAISVESIHALRPDAIVLSPGPCTPDEAGVSLAVVRALAGEFPIFGVCLGHQTIAQAFGGKVVRAPELMHGKVSEIFHDGRGLFTGLPNPFTATRYHSLIVDAESLPNCLRITAKTESGLIMAIEQLHYPVVGVQFHPESILTECGQSILQSFLQLYIGESSHAA